MDESATSMRGLDRRRLMGGLAAAVASGSVGRSLLAPDAARAGVEPGASWQAPVPRPIPGGIPIGGGEHIHTWAPGPPSVTLPFSGATLGGLDVDASAITDFNGAVALAYLVGTATGSDGATYNLETDIRAFSGEFVATDGIRRRGAFAFI
jgi:hypothetical protein